MITETMTASELYREVKKDMHHVVHALIKSYGGRQRYEADCRQMAEDVLRQPEGTLLLGNVESCTCGRTGNHWIVYSYAKNAGFRTASSGHRAFVWMDTPDGSISAIQFSDQSRDSAWSPLIFSGHFFQRYAEREGLGAVDLQLVTDFMRQNVDGVFQADEHPTSPGRYRFDVILRGGIGRGYTSGFDPEQPQQMFVSHVRTYLPTSMLNPRQRQLTAEARSVQASKSRPVDTFVSKIMDGDDRGLLDYFTDLFIARGLPPRDGRSFTDLMTQIVLHQADITPPPPEGRTPSQLRALFLQLYQHYELNVFEYVIANRNKSEHHSMLEVLTVAKVTTPDLDVRAMLTSMMEPSPDDQKLLDFIERTASNFESRFQQHIANGKFFHSKSDTKLLKLIN